MMEWLHMNGDGIYVWPCYVLTFIVLVANVWVARAQHTSLLKRVTARAQRTLAKQAQSEKAVS